MRCPSSSPCVGICGDSVRWRRIRRSAALWSRRSPLRERALTASPTCSANPSPCCGSAAVTGGLAAISSTSRHKPSPDKKRIGVSVCGRRPCRSSRSLARGHPGAFTRIGRRGGSRCSSYGQGLRASGLGWSFAGRRKLTISRPITVTRESCPASLGRPPAPQQRHQRTQRCRRALTRDRHRRRRHAPLTGRRFCETASPRIVILETNAQDRGDAVVAPLTLPSS